MTSQQALLPNIEHHKRIKGWTVFYLIFAAAQVVLSLYSMLIRDSYEIWWVVLPYVVLAALSFGVNHYKNKVWVVVFGIFYLLLHSTMVTLENLSGGGGVLSLVSWVGIIGVFQCWISINKLKNSK